MNDPYLIPGTSVLKNKLNLTLQPDLDEAEADYAALRLRGAGRAATSGKLWRPALPVLPSLHLPGPL